MLIVQQLALHKKYYMHIQTIDIEGIVTMLKIVPKDYKTNNIKVARGKYKMPTTLKQLIKKLANG
jgi:hypothetical protein